jgi:hypothetical protein
VPTANSAAGGKPTNSASTVRRRIRNTFIALGLSLSVVLPAGLLVAGGVAAAGPGGNDCSRWTSYTKPPDYIRVYRNRTGRIDRVPFRKYLVVVLGKEWPGYLPHALIEAGAVAAKQFAWYHALQGPRRTKDGRCFDVRDGIQDQLYKPGKSRVRPDHYDAVDATWHITLIKSERFFMTGYRRGQKGRCGRDATGWKLFARTATRCAYSGKDFMQILRIYYGPDLTIRRGDNATSSAQTSSAQTSSAQTLSAQKVSAQPPTRSVLLHVL